MTDHNLAGIILRFVSLNYRYPNMCKWERPTIFCYSHYPHATLLTEAIQASTLYYINPLPGLEGNWCPDAEAFGRSWLNTIEAVAEETGDTSNFSHTNALTRTEFVFEMTLRPPRVLHGAWERCRTTASVTCPPSSLQAPSITPRLAPLSLSQKIRSLFDMFWKQNTICHKHPSHSSTNHHQASSPYECMSEWKVLLQEERCSNKLYHIDTCRHNSHSLETCDCPWETHCQESQHL